MLWICKPFPFFEIPDALLISNFDGQGLINLRLNFVYLQLLENLLLKIVEVKLNKLKFCYLSVFIHSLRVIETDFSIRIG